MTIRQRLLKWVYPVLLSLRKLRSGKNILISPGDSIPTIPFYQLSVELINGKQFSFEELKGKKVLLVNTASDCGYTAQYAELQKLYQHSKEDLQIIAFPANDFKDQEQSDDHEIEQFCQKNYGVRFPLAKKTVVVDEAGQHPVFKWLTHKDQNGWNEKKPEWNFAKYLVNEEGRLTHYFAPEVSPLSTEIIRAVHQ
jgi:glutathione peroxidase